MDDDIHKEISHVENVLEDIRKNTATPWWRTILNGFLYGAGWVVGTVGMIAALGWLLSIFGVIPGFDVIAAQLQAIMHSKF
jgi:hypothetical protein